MIELIPPILRDLYGISLLILLYQMIAAAAGMGDDAAHVVRVESIKDIKEVLSIRGMSLGKFVRKVEHEYGILLEMREEILDRELIILWHVDELDILQFEELLPLSKNRSEEVFVHHDIWREV